MRLSSQILSLLIAAVPALSCATAGSSATAETAGSADTSLPTPGAVATLVDSAGATVGTATFRQAQPGVRVDVELRGVPDGAHGIHLHEVGACAPKDFDSAGAHFDTEGKKHGLKNPAGPHAGDLPNITVQGGRSTAYTTTTQRVTLDPGGASLFDADSTALVVHAAPDDDVTDPSGNSGARIACGVVRKAP
jgi:Cu-Zn family superoxide dismutase